MDGNSQGKGTIFYLTHVEINLHKIFLNELLLRYITSLWSEVHLWVNISSASLQMWILLTGKNLNRWAKIKGNQQCKDIENEPITYPIFFFPHAPIGLAAWASDRDGNAISLLMSGAVLLRLGAKKIIHILFTTSKHIWHIHHNTNIYQFTCCTF